MRLRKIICLVIVVLLLFNGIYDTFSVFANQAKAVNMVSVTDYGAKGDGLTDDTVAIKNAIKAMEEGDTLYFQKGIYIISSVLVIKKSNIVIQGEEGAIIKYKDYSDKSGGVFIIHTANIKGSIENVTFKNITIDGNKDNRTTGKNTGYGICIVRHVKDYEVKNISIINCKIYDTPGRAVSVAGCKEIKEKKGEDPLYELGIKNYSERYTTYNELIANETLNGYEDINTREYTTRYPVVNLLIQDCFFDNTSCGINQNTTDGTKIINNTISNSCTVENITIDYSDNCQVIGNTLLAYNGGCGNIGTDESNNCIIKDNLIDNTKSNLGREMFNVGICHNSAAGSSNNYIIENNTIIGANYGIWLKDHRKYIIEDGISYSNGGSRAGSGFYLINNKIENCKNNGIRIDEMTGSTYLVNNIVNNDSKKNGYKDININEYNYKERFNESNIIDNIWQISTRWTNEDKKTTVTVQSDRELHDLENWQLSNDKHSLTTTYSSSDTTYETTDVEEKIQITDVRQNTYDLKISTTSCMGNMDNGYLPIIGSTKSGKVLRMGYSNFDVNENGMYKSQIINNIKYQLLTDSSKEECDGDNVYLIFDNIRSRDTVEFYINDLYLNDSTEDSGNGYYGIRLSYSADREEFEPSQIHYPTRSSKLKQFSTLTEKIGDSYRVIVRFNRYLLVRSVNELKMCVKIVDGESAKEELIFKDTKVSDIKTWQSIKLTPANMLDYESDIIQKLVKNKEKIEAKKAKESHEDENVIDLMIFMGESNMLGLGAINNVTEEKVEAIKDENGNTINKEFKLYANKMQREENPRIIDMKEPFGLYQNVTENGKLSQSSGSMITALTNSYYKETGVPVVAVSSSVGSKSVYSWWNEETGHDIGLQDAITKYTAAVKYLKENGYKIRNKYMVWCQGESDSGTQAVLPIVTNAYYEKYLKQGVKYEDKLKSIINTMSNINDDNNETIGIDTAFIIRIGHKSGSYAMKDDIMEIQTKLCKESPNVILASTAFKALSLCKYAVWDGTKYQYQYTMRNDQLHYHQKSYNLVGYDAGKNIAYYTNTGCEPTLTDYLINTETNTLEETTYIGCSTKITGIEVTSNPVKTSYIKGTELDLTRGKITVTYEDESTKEINMTGTGVTISGYDKAKIGKQRITVTYRGKTAYFFVQVIENDDYLLGDVDGNGKVDAQDAVMILKYVAHNIKLTDKQLLAANTTKDEDGIVDAEDAVQILKLVAHNISEF